MAVETCAEKQARLVLLDAAIFKLISGGQVTSVRSGEKEVRYSAGHLGTLRALRDQLANEVAACTGLAVSGRRRLIYITPSDR